LTDYAKSAEIAQKLMQMIADLLKRQTMNSQSFVDTPELDKDNAWFENF